MTRTYGALAQDGGQWVITAAEPHVVIKLKAVFPKIPKTEPPPYRFRIDPEVATDLEWFLQRYPMKTEPAVLRALRAGRQTFEALQTEMETLLAPDYVPPAYAGLGVDPQTGQPYQVRHYQAQAVEMLTRAGGLLLADEVGLGKTYVTAAAMLVPGALPGVVVCHAHLQKQWVEVIERFTTLRAHAIAGTKPYAIPPCDVRVFRYTQLQGWFDMLGAIGVGLVAFDEIQDLRNGTSTEKGRAAKRLCDAAARRLGLSATPIYNYGSEIYNVMGFIAPEALGDWGDFDREWAGEGGRIADPKALGTYLRERRSFLRRTKKDVGQELPAVSRIVDQVDHERAELASIDDLAYALAVKATTAEFTERGEAARMLDMRVRHATGVAKARAVADVVRILVEGGEPVVLCGWHRQVYDIWKTKLGNLNPVFYTGAETASAKADAVKAFVGGKSDLFIMSLRSGAGLDGLQHRCSTMVFGELDWSPGIHHQCIGRLDREGQQNPVTALFLVIDDGADPPMMEVLGLKASQAAAIMDPSLGVQAAETDDSNLKKLAQRYLDKRGVTAPEAIERAEAVARREAAE